MITDAYSRKIVGYHLAKNLKAAGCMKALDNALKTRVYPTRTLIHHSDRGTQYCCDDYVAILKKERVKISMTQTGNPYDNALAERVNGILKMELDLQKTFRSFSQASASVAQAIGKYNTLRLHMSCNFQTPETTHILENVAKTNRKISEYSLCKPISGKSEEIKYQCKHHLVNQKLTVNNN